MAKILFIVNQHPNEAFAISVANETAKKLRKKGHEVVVKKTNFKETMLGRVLHSKRRKKFSDRDLRRMDSALALNNRLALERNKSIQAVYDFHCTGADNPYWRRDSSARPDGPVSSGRDFVIEHHVGGYNVVEIKAHYTPFPAKLAERVNSKISDNGVYHKTYLTRTSSNQLTRERGLTKSAFAEKIAGIIHELHTKGLPKSRFITQGIVPRVFPKKKRPNPLRRHRK